MCRFLSQEVRENRGHYIALTAAKVSILKLQSNAEDRDELMERPEVKYEFFASSEKFFPLGE